MAGFGNLQISKEFHQIQESSMFVSFGGEKRIINEGSEEDILRKESKKIKNRASAARSREKKVERLKYLEEKVEELREENAQLERLIKLMETEQDQEEKKLQTVAEESAGNKLKGLRRTWSSPW